MKAAEEDGALPPRIVLFLFFIAFLPLFAIQFGVGNQLEQFSVIERLRNPAFAPGDFYIDSAADFGQPRYYYSLLIATLTNLAPLHVVIHGLTVFHPSFWGSQHIWQADV